MNLVETSAKKAKKLAQGMAAIPLRQIQFLLPLPLQKS